MIYVFVSDRLGNILFQVGTALSLNKKVVIISTDYKQNLFLNQFKNTFLKNITIIDYIPENISIFNEIEFKFNEITNNNNIILKGYFQSFKYINRDIVLNQFSPTDILINNIYKKHPFLINKNFTSVHIRRGDYLKQQYKHPFVGKKYINEAMKIIGHDYLFVILSDDILWCKKNISSKQIYFVENSNTTTDFFIQTLSYNNIISNSSYSLWAAYLNCKKNIAIAPSMWFGFSFKENYNDIYPSDFIILKNDYSLYNYFIAWLQFIYDFFYFKFFKFNEK
jgi:hypothetical protein